MAVFSKLIGKWFTSSHCSCLKMVVSLDTLYPPYGIFIPVLSTLFMCVVSFYLFKWLGGDMSVTLRDVSKNHSWKPIKLSSKVRKLRLITLQVKIFISRLIYYSLYICFFSHGIALFASLFS